MPEQIRPHGVSVEEVREGAVLRARHKIRTGAYDHPDALEGVLKGLARDLGVEIVGD